MKLKIPQQTILLSSKTLFVAAIGTLVAYALSLPVFVLTGPAIAVTAANLLGARLDVAPVLRDAAFLLIGVGIGASINEEVMASFLRWPPAFVALAIMLVAILFLCRAVLTRSFGYDSQTAVLASTPGHLSTVITLGTEMKLDVVQITVMQAVRLLLLTLAVPSVAFAMGVDVNVSPLPAGDPMLLPEIIVTVVLALLVGLALKKLKTPAALVIGGLLVSGAAHTSGQVTGVMPDVLIYPCFVVIGAIIGARFVGVTIDVLKKALAAGGLTTGISVMAAALAAWPVAQSLDMPLVHVLIAFAPGGLETMIAMGVILNVSPGFVVACHVARLAILLILLPVFLGRREKA